MPPHSPHRALPRRTSAARTHTPLAGASLLWVGAAPDAAAADALAANGVRLHWVADGRGALDAPLADALVIDAALPDGDGLVLLEELRRRAPDLTTVVLAAQPSFDVCRRAFRLGARDVLPRPTAIADLVAALARAARGASMAPDALFEAADAGADDLPPLAAALLVAGADPALRARIVTAAAESIAAGARVTLRVQRLNDHFRLDAHGIGFAIDAADAWFAAGAEAASNGLARAAALADRFDVRAGGDGLALRFEFDAGCATRTSADDLADREWLEPADAVRLLEDLDGASPARVVSPAVAVVLGRWVGERARCNAERRAQRVLWS